MQTNPVPQFFIDVKPCRHCGSNHTLRFRPALDQMLEAQCPIANEPILADRNRSVLLFPNAPTSTAHA